MLCSRRCSFLAALVLASTGASQGALLRRQGDLLRVPAGPGLRACLTRLLAGPTPAEAARGDTTDVPAGTRLTGLTLFGRTARLTLSAEFLAALKNGTIEGAIEQIVKTTVRAGAIAKVFISVRGRDGRVRSLDSLLPRPRLPAGAPPRLGPSAVAGALSGKTIAVSPGHGSFWSSTAGWTWARPLIDGLREDLHTNEITLRYLIPALENMGARVISCRERGEIPSERIGDNDQGVPVYRETGSWSTSSSSGYNNRTYRFAITANRTTATATWTLSLPRDGIYPVHVFFRAGSNRPADARFLVHHSGGVTEVRVDQTRDDRRWVHLGDFAFSAATGARIELHNRSAFSGRAVIADAVRVGAGLGSIVRGGRSSGRPRWQEAARYWAEYDQAPSSVWNSSSAGDQSDDVRARPLYAEWRGADAYISLHTNAGGGSGTSSFIHNTSPTKGSAALQRAVQTRIVADIRSLFDPSWVDRGARSANFGEVRLLKTMPGVLVELAFHDRPNTKDHKALHDPHFRLIAGRAYARGVMRHFKPTAPFPPTPPTGLRVTQDGNRGLRIAWEPVTGASLYSIERSPNGKGFVEAAQTPATSWSTGPLPHGSLLSFRVRALNASGRSFPSEVLCAGTSHLQTAELLLVQGFDRLDRRVKGPDNTRDYLRLHGAAIRGAGEFSLGFDAASNEAVTLGRVKLGGYRAIDWLLGEESTKDETFSSTEQSFLAAYLKNGGRLLLSGAEIGFDLDLKGSAADRLFYRGLLGANFVADDARTHGFRAVNGGIFAGLGAGSFDDGTHGTYDVDFPDVIAPSDAKSNVALRYTTGGVAAIQRTDGAARVVHLAFPLETIVEQPLRQAIMARSLRFLLFPRAFEAAPEVARGTSQPLRVTLPAEAGATYVLLGSLRLGTISLPGGHLLPLVADGVFGLTLVPQSPVFRGFLGTLDGGGRGTGRFVVPNLPILRGLRFYFSGLTLRPGPSVRSLLPWVRISVR